MKKLLLYSVLSILLFGCGPNVSTKKMANTSLTNYETFAFLPNSDFDDFEKFESENNVGSDVIEQVNKNMKEEGYEIDRSNPDLLVLLDAKIDLETKVTKEPVYTSYPTYYGEDYRVRPYYQKYYYYDFYSYNDLIVYETDFNTYEEGNLTLLLVDSDTKQVVWKANATSFIGERSDSDAISKFVDEIFDEFPDTK